MNSPAPVNQKLLLAQRSVLLAGLSVADCATIVAGGHERHFSRRETIFIEGDPMRQVLLLLTGSVKLTQFGQSGSEVILRLTGPGEVLGALAACVTGDHGSSAQTLESTSALVWDNASFEALSDRFPALRRNAVRILEQRLREMDQRFREVSTEKVAPRLSSQLVRLFTQVGKRTNGSVEISLSREELAQLIGTTLFTVSRLLCQWESLGIVNARRESVMLLDLPALSRLAEGE